MAASRYRSRKSFISRAYVINVRSGLDAKPPDVLDLAALVDRYHQLDGAVLIASDRAAQLLALLHVGGRAVSGTPHSGKGVETVNETGRETHETAPSARVAHIRQRQSAHW